jgi:hypothetical protein
MDTKLVMCGREKPEGTERLTIIDGAGGVEAVEVVE